LIVHETSPAGTLTGILPLGVSRGGRHAVLPGAEQGEYKSWLASSRGGAFFDEALELLARQTRVGSISCRYLPPAFPADEARSALAERWRCESESYPRPIVPLSDPKRFAEYMGEKRNRTLRNLSIRLNKIGEVRLERIRSVDELLPVFDRLIGWYEARQQSAHGKSSFGRDKNKKPWHLDLLREGLLHVSVLKTGQEIVSGCFGLSDGKTYTLAMPMYAAEYAQYSPMALHFLALVEQLQQEGYSLFDLTPGDDPFKKRFASEYGTVHSLSVYLNSGDWMKANVRRKGSALAKRALSVLGLTAGDAQRGLGRLRAALKRPAPRSS
jgi:CelD/BcsL family acetyltransferase involved in cellulose biosynthesis